MADAPDLGSGAARCRSSSLLSRTIRDVRLSGCYLKVFFVNSIHLGKKAATLKYSVAAFYVACYIRIVYYTCRYFACIERYLDHVLALLFECG